jgi:DNA-binding SARP family transcriptional activator
MDSVLNIRLLDNFHLDFAGEPITSANSAPIKSLLAYLLLHRDSPQSRQYLAYRLWPDSTEAQARTNLRRELHLLRRALPHTDTFLHVDAKFLQWRSDAPYTLDVADFEAAVSQVEQCVDRAPEGAKAVGDGVALRAMLEKAVALYPGDLLPSCYDDWIVLERERLSQVFAGLLEKLIELLERQGDYPLAIRYAQRLRRYDPLHEATYRHLMRLYALNGDRARALRVYHTCVTTLRRELGVDPTLATRQTYERLLDVESSSTQGVLTNPSPLATLVAEGRLIGRQPEWEMVKAAWHIAAPRGEPGQAHFVLVTGDAGVGKTRLVEELLEWAGQQGIATSRTRCYATEGQLALAPVAEWLSADTFRKPLLGLDPVWLTDVARLLPGILVERPELPRPAPFSESGQRLHLFKALAQVVLTDHHPLLLVIDDLQWCDRETLEWLHYLLRCAPQKPLLLAGTARPEEVGPDHPLRALTLALRSTGQVTEIDLGPLSPSETVELATQVIGRDLDPDMAIYLHAETEGNPLFVVEMVRAQWKPQIVQVSNLKSGSKLPPKVYAIIQSRLGQLSPQARELADLAATIGRSFTFNVLAQAGAARGGAQDAVGGGADEETLVRGLDELWQRRIIREQEVDAYDFSHDKIREVAYAEISRARQQLLHRRVAQALESVHATDLDSWSGQIASHYERAGLFQEAVLHYQRAAEVARRVYAYQEAKALYSRAIEAGRHRRPALDEVQLLPVYEGRGLVNRALSQLDDAIVDFQNMRRIARAVGNTQKEGESLCQLAYSHWLTFSEGQMHFVEQYAQEAAECFAQSGDQSIRARSLTMLGAVDQVHRNLTEAGRKLKEALEISRRAGDKDALVQALSFLCLQAYLQGNSQSTVRFAQEGVSVAREVQDGFNELRIQAFLCQGHWSTGNYAHAFSLVHETMTQAEERGNAFVRGRLLNTLGWFHHELGDFAKAIAYNQASVELGRASRIDNVEISALINLGYDHLALDQPYRAFACFEPTLERVQREGFGAHKWRWQMKLFMGLAEHAYDTVAYEQALSWVDLGLEEALATSSQKYVAKGWALRGKILRELGKSEAAGAEFRRAFALTERLQTPSLFYPVAFALGEWYEAMGQKREAAALYATAKATVEQMATAVGDETLVAVFLQSESVQWIAESWARTL